MVSCKCICSGDGQCLTKWDCHFCRLPVCCSLIECRNFKYCHLKHPRWISDLHNGLCIKCSVQMGQHIYTNKVKECCVCLKNNIMLILKCNHMVCNDCWYNITKKDLYNPSLCPLCLCVNE
jgi:hypothetical protein